MLEAVGYSTLGVSGLGGTAVDQTFTIGVESVASDVQLAITYFDVWEAWNFKRSHAVNKSA